jgi:hypothetical protein
MLELISASDRKNGKGLTQLSSEVRLAALGMWREVGDSVADVLNQMTSIEQRFRKAQQSLQQRYEDVMSYTEVCVPFGFLMAAEPNSPFVAWHCVKTPQSGRRRLDSLEDVLRAEIKSRLQQHEQRAVWEKTVEQKFSAGTSQMKLECNGYHLTIVFASNWQCMKQLSRTRRIRTMLVARFRKNRCNLQRKSLGWKKPSARWESSCFQRNPI